MNEDPTMSPIRIKWEVPLPWLISGAVLMFIQAMFLYFGQIRLGELQVEQSVSIKELAKKVGELSVLIGSNNLKDVEHDLKLADHERRMQSLEARSFLDPKK